MIFQKLFSKTTCMSPTFSNKTRNLRIETLRLFLADFSSLSSHKILSSLLLLIPCFVFTLYNNMINNKDFSIGVNWFVISPPSLSLTLNPPNKLMLLFDLSNVFLISSWGAVSFSFISIETGFLSFFRRENLYKP